MTQIHIMLDLETWGTTPGSDIRSIGACVFDPVSGWVGGYNNHALGSDLSAPRGKTFYVATDNPIRTSHPTEQCPSCGYDALYWRERKYPLTRNPQTVQWWSEQSDEAQAAFADPVDLRECLRQFGKWLRSVSPLQDYYDIGEHDRQFPDDIRLWSHGSHFDVPILAAAYEAVGLPVPWHYRAPRDTRTIFDAAGIDDHSAWLAQHPGPLGLQHHALDDAICQARAVCGAWARIGSVSDTQFDEISGAMVNLSALMQRAGFFDDDHNHAAYERVVKLWQNAIGHPDRNW